MTSSSLLLSAQALDQIRHILAGRIAWCPLPPPTDKLFAARRQKEFAVLARSGWPLMLGMPALIGLAGWQLFYAELQSSAGHLWWCGLALEVLLMAFFIAVLQFPRTQKHYQPILVVAGWLCLAIPVYGTIALGDLRLIRMTSYLCMLFINVQILSLRLSLPAAAICSVGGVALAVLIALVLGNAIDWSMLLWFCGGSLNVTLFIGAILERQERISFLQSLLLKYEARERERLNQKLDRMAHHDALSGLANRRYFDLLLEREWERLRREEKNLAALFIDVDHFKNFNDTYGHAAGDVCLSAVGRVLAEAVRRPGDVAARYGGEEFVVLLPEADLEGAREVAERIIADIDALNIKHGASVAGHVTVSIGLCITVPQHTNTAANLLKRADAALYAAKRAGRHRLMIANNESIEASVIS